VGFADDKAQREATSFAKRAGVGGGEGAGLKSLGRAEKLAGAEGVARRREKKFSKVLDGAAKADQNLASLLKMPLLNAATLMAKDRSDPMSLSELFGCCEKKFSKILDDEAKSRS
jgi:hypothetical protein